MWYTTGDTAITTFGFKYELLVLTGVCERAPTQWLKYYVRSGYRQLT